MTSVSRATRRLPSWARSIRFRMTLLYSSVLFLLAALLLGSLYLGLSISLRDEPISRQLQIVEVVEGNGEIPEGQTFVDSRAFEQRVNTHTLETLRNASFGALGALFVASLAVGWVIAGRALRPVERITSVAREIQAANLDRRIELSGPDDELTRLAGTFDEMLDRLDLAFASQRRFVADASHELRNPLAIIQTNAELILADSEATPEISRRAGRIRRASDRMLNLVEDLLALARLEARPVERERIDLGRLLSELGDEFLASARRRGVELVWTAPEGLRFHGDRAGLKRALANLTDNALRFAPSGSPVRLAAGRDDGWAWLAVADSGPGIPAAEQERIFDRFYRLDKARSRADGGSGLGLAITREIIEAHQGEIRLFSSPGRGSMFVVWLPLEPVRTAAPALQPA